MAHKLLLADDSATIQRVVELTFASEDIEVVTVSDGTRAIEAIERAAPDIVLADVSMPGKNGYDVASFVRNDPARDRIPLVLLTGAFEPLDEARCDAIGRHEVLVKPFEPREMIGKVRELLNLPATDVSDVPSVVVAAEAATESASAADLLGPSGPSGADTTEAVEPVDPTGDRIVDPPTVDPSVDPTGGEPEATATGEAVATDPVTPLEAETPAAAEGDSTPDQAEADSAPPAEATSVAAERVPQAGAGGSVLAESFKTFLAVEQGAAAPALPAGGGAAGPGDAAPALPDAVMDELVKRVLMRLTDTVLQDAVAEVVSRIAERLAREEITRVSPGGE